MKSTRANGNGASIRPVELANAKMAYSVEEAAELLSISRAKMVELVGQRRIGSIKIDNRRLVTRQDLDEYVAERREVFKRAS